MKKLICIIGPTAIGKTALAIEVAQKLNTEIISADSRQFYKEISIGTAKPSDEELAKVPHHFIGNISIHQTYSAGDFERDAMQLLEQLYQKYDTLVLVGGSGLYIKALLEGLDKMPEGDEALREELDILFAEKGIAALQQRLLNNVFDAASRLDLQNPQRVMRAIEIAERGGITQTKKERFFTPLQIALDMERGKLYHQINSRVDSMIENGLIEEAEDMFPHKNLYALQTVGYKELFDFFDGNISKDKAIDLIKQHTRNYAKRQLTWFRREKNIQWFNPSQDEGIMNSITSFLKH